MVLGEFNLPSVLYVDVTTSSKRAHPDIMVVDLGGDKTLALQVRGTMQIMGRTCNTTQVSTLFICPAFTPGEEVQWDTDII